MELYEVLYTVPACEIDPVVDKTIRFNWIDEDELPYEETVEVKEVEYEGQYVIVTGFSHVLNMTDEFGIYEDTEIEVLGG